MIKMGEIYLDEESLLTLPTKHTTSLQRRCNVTTLQRRCKDVDATLCVCWVSNLHVKSTTLGQPTHIYPRPVEPSYALPLQIV